MAVGTIDARTGDPTEAEVPPPPARRRWSAIVALAVVGVVGLRLALSLPLHGPRVFPDETGYLLTARWLAGEGATPDLGPSPFYHPGLSLLLAPFLRVAHDPTAAYRVALAVNALCWGAAFLLLRQVLGVVFAPLDRRATAAALVACLYPAAVVTSTLAWSESLLALVFLAFLLGAAHLARRPAPGAAAAFAALAAVTYLVHPRSIGLLLLAAALLVALRATARLSTRALVAGLATLAVATAAVVVLDGVLESRLYGPGKLVGAGGEAGLLSPARLTEALRRAVGQVWYATVATWGMAPIGLGALGAVLLRRRRARLSLVDDPRPVVAGLTLASVAAVLATSSAFSTGTRIDALVFGRYVEAVLPLALAAGVLWLLRADAPAR
nr:hypothetical protein [Acidimicrobiia bacterium]